jgi:hypothetical protein
VVFYGEGEGEEIRGSIRGDGGEGITGRVKGRRGRLNVWCILEGVSSGEEERVEERLELMIEAGDGRGECMLWRQKLVG